MNAAKNAPTIEDLFSLLDEWRNLPAYRLEPRADPFFALFLKDVIAKHFKTDIHPIIIPEMPLRRGTLWDENKDSPNKSVKVDYAVFAKDRSIVYLVELKTEGDSYDVDQERYLIRAQKVRFRELIKGIRDIALATAPRFIPKYIHLLWRLGELGFVDVPAAVYASSFPLNEHDAIEQLHLVQNLVGEPGPTIEIVYIFPTFDPDRKFIDPNRECIYFDEFAGIAKFKGELGHIFADHLGNWKTKAGSQDPRKFDVSP
jgi:hypothetical protein